MADLLAVVSKAIFEKEDLALGDVWPTARYASAGKGLQALAEGGRLFLVTVRPPDEVLWLVAILEQPKFDGSGWKARANTTPIREVKRAAIEFANGATLPTKAGVLAMSLQTPRALSAATATALAGARKVASRSAAPKTRAAKTAPRKPSAKATSAKPASAKVASAKPSTAKRAPVIDEPALLARWRKTRSPRIADVLQAAPLDFGDLARGKPASKGVHQWFPKLIELVEVLPDDPRVAVFFVESVQKARWPGSSSAKLWSRVFAKLIALGDVRAVAPLRAAVATPPRFFGAAFTATILEQIGQTAETLAKRKPKADPAEDALLAANPVDIPKGGWLRATTSGEADRWLASVWAAPDDDGVRSVAADALLEQGDPWGELISLQLLGGAKDREAELIRKHGRRFAGPIAEVCAIANMVFERGFLATCDIGRHMVGRRFWEEVASAPHWATVRSVKLDTYPDSVPQWWIAQWYGRAPLASVRELTMGNIVLKRTAATAPWTIEAPQRPIDWNLQLAAQLLKAMPQAERDRIPPPKSEGMRRILGR